MASVDQTGDMGRVTQYTAARYPVLRKFHVGQHPLLIEDQMKEMRPLPMTERAAVDSVVRALTTEASNPLDNRLSEKEISKWRQRKLLDGLPDNVQHWFSMEFTRWLRGVSQFNHPQFTWWGNHNMFYVPEVVEYLKEMVRMRLDYQQRLLMMTVAMPKTLNDCWLYFKYIVAGHGLLMRQRALDDDNPRGMYENSDFYDEQEENPPSFMTIGGMLDFLDDFAQTTFYAVDVPAMQGSHYGTDPPGVYAPSLQRASAPMPDGAVQSTTDNTGDDPGDPDPNPGTDAAGKPQRRTLGHREPPALPPAGGASSGDDDDDDDDDDGDGDTSVLADAARLAAATARAAASLVLPGKHVAPTEDEARAAYEAEQARLAAATSTSSSSSSVLSSTPSKLSNAVSSLFGALANLAPDGGSMNAAEPSDDEDEAEPEKDDKSKQKDKEPPAANVKPEPPPDTARTTVIKPEPAAAARPNLYPDAADVPDQPSLSTSATGGIRPSVERAKQELLDDITDYWTNTLYTSTPELYRLRTDVGAARTRENINTLRDRFEELKPRSGQAAPSVAGTLQAYQRTLRRLPPGLAADAVRRNARDELRSAGLQTVPDYTREEALHGLREVGRALGHPQEAEHLVRMLREARDPNVLQHYDQVWRQAHQLFRAALGDANLDQTARSLLERAQQYMARLQGAPGGVLDRALDVLGALPPTVRDNDQVLDEVLDHALQEQIEALPDALPLPPAKEPEPEVSEPPPPPPSPPGPPPEGGAAAVVATAPPTEEQLRDRMALLESPLQEPQAVREERRQREQFEAASLAYGALAPTLGALRDDVAQLRMRLLEQPTTTEPVAAAPTAPEPVVAEAVVPEETLAKAVRGPLRQVRKQVEQQSQLLNAQLGAMQERIEALNRGNEERRERDRLELEQQRQAQQQHFEQVATEQRRLLEQHSAALTQQIQQQQLDARARMEEAGATLVSATTDLRVLEEDVNEQRRRIEGLTAQVQRTAGEVDTARVQEIERLAEEVRSKTEELARERQAAQVRTQQAEQERQRAQEAERQAAQTRLELDLQMAKAAMEEQRARAEHDARMAQLTRRHAQEQEQATAQAREQLENYLALSQRYAAQHEQLQQQLREAEQHRDQVHAQVQQHMQQLEERVAVSFLEHQQVSREDLRQLLQQVREEREQLRDMEVDGTAERLQRMEQALTSLEQREMQFVRDEGMRSAALVAQTVAAMQQAQVPAQVLVQMPEVQQLIDRVRALEQRPSEPPQMASVVQNIQQLARIMEQMREEQRQQREQAAASSSSTAAPTPAQPLAPVPVPVPADAPPAVVRQLESLKEVTPATAAPFTHAVQTSVQTVASVGSTLLGAGANVLTSTASSVLAAVQGLFRREEPRQVQEQQQLFEQYNRAVMQVRNALDEQRSDFEPAYREVQLYEAHLRNLAADAHRQGNEAAAVELARTVAPLRILLNEAAPRLTHRTLPVQSKAKRSAEAAEFKSEQPASVVRGERELQHVRALQQHQMTHDVAAARQFPHAPIAAAPATPSVSLSAAPVEEVAMTERPRTPELPEAEEEDQRPLSSAHQLLKRAMKIRAKEPVQSDDIGAIQPGTESQYRESATEAHRMGAEILAFLKTEEGRALSEEERNRLRAEVERLYPRRKRQTNKANKIKAQSGAYSLRARPSPGPNAQL